MNGKFIVLYGANNLGKSTQVDLLVKAFQARNISVRPVKYPIYDLVPTGPRINSVLREGSEMDELELQRLYAQNRRDFESSLKKWLEEGIFVVAEDYVGTGIAWGLTRGVELSVLEEINEGMYPADISLMLRGARFSDGVEHGHRNEEDEEIWKKACEKHDLLAKRYGWMCVNANQTREKVHGDIMELLEKSKIL